MNPALCTECGGEGIYHHRYDTYYCDTCDRWLEGRCSDATCEFCGSRPERPSQDVRRAQSPQSLLKDA